MHLRSKIFIKSGHQSVREVVSRISSKESVTQRVGLETIVEDTTNILSTTSESSMASQGSHPSQQVGTSQKYNMTLEYKMKNSYGARPHREICSQDWWPWHRVLPRVSISVQEDRYIDPYATMYLVVEEPLSYNQWGIKIEKTRGKQPIIEDMKTPPLVDPSLFQHKNFVLLQWMQVDDPTLGL